MLQETQRSSNLSFILSQVSFLMTIFEKFNLNCWGCGAPQEDIVIRDGVHELPVYKCESPERLLPAYYLPEIGGTWAQKMAPLLQSDFLAENIYETYIYETYEKIYICSVYFFSVWWKNTVFSLGHFLGPDMNLEIFPKSPKVRYRK